MILVLNGPNLGRLGTRQPTVYGTVTPAELAAACTAEAAALGVPVEVRQTDQEGELLGWLHEAADSASGVLLNPGAWTHYSYAVADAVALVTEAGVPVIEVHLSQPAAREGWRRRSVVAPYVTGTVSGFGVDSYRLALRGLGPRLARRGHD